MQINVIIIPHKQQRYNTVGDWWIQDGNCSTPDCPGHPVTLQVRVSKMDDERYEMLVAHHEITEALTCYFAGINEKEVTKFDEDFEKARKNNIVHDATGAFYFHGRNVDSLAEPGDEPDAPYYRQHQVATGFERILAAEFDVVWGAYESHLNDLADTYEAEEKRKSA